jgi:hypothetical protein
MREPTRKNIMRATPELREATRPGRFPEAVRIKTPTRTFNLFFYFALSEDGRIWVKSIPGAHEKTETVAPDWQLFLGTGLPYDLAKADFTTPRRIVAINADLDEVMVVSDDHRHYSLRWFENPVFKETTPPGTWSDQYGWPVEGPLVWDGRVARNRGWAIGRRTRTHVLFEDIAGRTHDGGGGLSTYYFLGADGTSIAFSDSGLPPDFSHTIGGPERSTFVAEAMEVCADTIFVINAYGELCTRMVDFDTNGADTMFFVYSYDRADPRKDAIAIPAEDWLAHKPIPLEGQAQIAARITIALTGKHNQDRELRVAGYGPDRQPGYYYKQIFRQAEGSATREEIDTWTFRPDETVSLEPDWLLDPADTDPAAERAERRTPVPVTRWRTRPKPPRRVAAQHMAFEGELLVDGETVAVAVTVPDFHLDWSPATLRLTAGSDSIEVTLHTVEKWYHLLRYDPGRDGTPQEFQATLEITQGAFATRNAVLRNLLDNVLGPYHLAAFAFFAQATEDYLEIESRPKLVKRAPQVALHLVRKGRGYPSLAFARHASLRHEAATASTRAAQLWIGRPLASLARADIPSLRRKIEDNRQAAKQLIRLAEAPEREDAATPRWLSPVVLGILRHLARPWLLKLLMPVLPFRDISPQEAAYYATNVATNIPPLLSRSRALKDVISVYVQRDLEQALSIIETRTAAYQRRIDQLEGNVANRPFSYFEELAGFWMPLRFGRRVAVLNRPVSVGGVPDCCLSVSDHAIFEPIWPTLATRRPARPGLLINITCEDATQPQAANLALRIIPTRLERDCFRASIQNPAPVGSEANPLRTQGSVQVDRAERTPATRAVLDFLFPPEAQASYEEITAELSVQAGHFRITSKSFAIEWRAEPPDPDDPDDPVTR